MIRTTTDADGNVITVESSEQEKKNSIAVTRDAKGAHKFDVKFYFDTGSEALKKEFIVE